MSWLEQLENDLRIYYLVASGLSALARDMCPRCTWFGQERGRTLTRLEEVKDEVRGSGELSDEEREMVCQHTGYFRAMVKVAEPAEELSDLREAGECRTKECMARNLTRMLGWAE